MKYVPGPAADAAAGGGRQHVAAAGLDSKSDTSENVVIGFAFNALSTIFVMLMASCAKLAGECPAPFKILHIYASSQCDATRSPGSEMPLLQEGRHRMKGRCLQGSTDCR